MLATVAAEFLASQEKVPFFEINLKLCSFHRC
jgi:hypothetical protein